MLPPGSQLALSDFSVAGRILAHGKTVQGGLERKEEMNTRMDNRIKRMAIAAVAAAAIAVPAAQAAGSDSYIGHPGGPGGVGLVPTLLDSSGSYIGHPGGPGGVGLISTAASPSASGGFDWADAAIGGGFVAGLGILGAGAALMGRRRGILVEQR